MRSFRRLASAAKGTLWLLRATGLRDHFSKVENHLHDLDSKVLHVASQSAAAIRVAENVQRLEKQITDVMTDVSSQHATTVRVAENVQRLGKHIVDVAASNLTNGRLSEQFQKLEKRLGELGSHHLANGRLTEQFQKLERHINEVAAHSLNGKLTEQFRKLEKHLDNAIAGSPGNQELKVQLQELDKHLAQLADSQQTTQDELRERLHRLETQLQATAPLAEQFQTIEQRLKEIPIQIEQALAGIAKMGSDAHRQREQTRWLQAQDLRAYEQRIHSAQGQDGIIQEILHRIGVEARSFVEIGVPSGLQSNCARLVREENWSGLFVESDPTKSQQLAEAYHANWRIRCLCARPTSENLEQLLAECSVPFNVAVLSIAVHGNDYWLWNSLNRWRPRLIVIEFNSHCPPGQRWVMQENPDHQWDGTSYYGASLASLTGLGRKKGYTLVATDSSGTSAFFVRDELATPERFLDPVVHYYYSLPNHGPFLGGNPLGSGPHVEI